jgi:predicted nucleic acid-binding protein
LLDSPICISFWLIWYYSVLTRLPIKPKPSIGQVAQALFGILTYCEAVVLEPVDDQAAIRRMVDLGLPGGGIFDAVIAQAAQKAGVECLLTLNAKDFTRLGPETSSIGIPGAGLGLLQAGEVI